MFVETFQNLVCLLHYINLVCYGIQQKWKNFTSVQNFLEKEYG